MQYLGHHPDGSGVQLHSAGGIYPYTIVVRERYDIEDDRFVRSHQVIGPGVDYECPTWDEAIAFAAARRAEYVGRNQPQRVERHVRQAPQGVGIEGDIKGQHVIGIREFQNRGLTETRYFVVGPRADSSEFRSRKLAEQHIEFIESDLYSIELQFQQAQRSWKSWAADRGSIR